jgi:formylglycine-generating enzyme required for sulfatase activity
MKIKITIDAPKGGLKRFALFVALPIAVVIAAAMVARGYDTSWIAANQPLTAAQLKANLDEVQARLAALEGAGDCPAGYTRDTSANTITLCKNGSDEVVKVGTGRAAFWIDRYEASLWDGPTGGTQYDGVAANSMGFLQNGQWTKPMYALSVKGVMPSASLTWFQAVEACRLSGKRLANGEEWLAAARGTVDAAGSCNINTAGVRATGTGSCVSGSGAEDLIGNIWEWTNEWYAAPGTGTTFAAAVAWPTNYNMDDAVNVQSWTYTYGGDATGKAGLPAAAMRGGAYNGLAPAGVFILNVGVAPSWWDPATGFRCVIK